MCTDSYKNAGTRTIDMSGCAPDPGDLILLVFGHTFRATGVCGGTALSIDVPGATLLNHAEVNAKSCQTAAVRFYMLTADASTAADGIPYTVSDAVNTARVEAFVVKGVTGIEAAVYGPVAETPTIGPMVDAEVIVGASTTDRTGAVGLVSITDVTPIIAGTRHAVFPTDGTLTELRGSGIQGGAMFRFSR